VTMLEQVPQWQWQPRRRLGQDAATTREEQIQSHPPSVGIHPARVYFVGSLFHRSVKEFAITTIKEEAHSLFNYTNLPMPGEPAH